MEKFVALMTARSWSGISQPGMRPVSAAFVPRMYSLQSPLLSSIQRPALFFLTIKPTRGGGVFESAGLMAGTKFAPLFGGGLRPPDGAAGKLTAFGFGRLPSAATPAPMIVLPVAVDVEVLEPLKGLRIENLDEVGQTA